jgi:hypothetical protein
MNDWTLVADRLPQLEWARRQALERGQTADRVEPPDPALSAALKRSHVQQAIDAMDKLNNLGKDTR